MINFFAQHFRPSLHEYVFIENDVVFKENATIVASTQRFRIVFSGLYENNENDRKWQKPAEIYCLCVKLNLNNLWLLLHRFAFSVKTILLHDSIVFKSFHSGDRFQKLLFLIVFVQLQGENAKKSLQFR